MELNSCIIKSEDFVDESFTTVPESGIEDRFNMYIHDVCKQITSFKDNNADGIIRIMHEDGTITYGIQEAKRIATSRFSQDATFMQALAYVAEFKMKYPHKLEFLKFLLMPCETQVCVMFLKDIHPQFVNGFCEIYLPLKVNKKLSASSVYKDRNEYAELKDVFDSILGSSRNKMKVFEIGEGLDYKDVVEYILENL